MRIEERIVSTWAAKLESDLVERVVADLIAMTPDEMLSGDSGLENVWEELCAQVQGEESIYWDAYELTITSFIEAYLEDLEFFAKLALWSRTDEGIEWISGNWQDDDGDERVPFDPSSVVQVVRDQLIQRASDYESKALYQYLYGVEDEEEDEGEDREERGN